MKPKCLICDMDGTLALLNGRDPYNASKCLDDELNKIVYTTVKLFCETSFPDAIVTNLIIVTGREERYKPETELWLNRHNIYPTAIHMRPTGNHSLTGYLLKGLILVNAILPEFDPILALEDDPRAAEMYRKNGIPCFLVREFEAMKK